LKTSEASTISQQKDYVGKMSKQQPIHANLETLETTGAEL